LAVATIGLSLELSRIVNEAGALQKEAEQRPTVPTGPGKPFDECIALVTEPLNADCGAARRRFIISE